MKPNKSSAVQYQGHGENDLERCLLRFVTKCLLSNQGARPSANQAEEVQGSFLCAPPSTLRRKLVFRVGNKREEACAQVPVQDVPLDVADVREIRQRRKKKQREDDRGRSAFWT